MSDANLQSRAVHLLSLARTVRHYEEVLTQANGERFNLFDILHVGHYEVRTHSPILAELLNPQGTHGQGGVFLRHFLTQLKIQDFDTESARVLPEVSIGEQGRLDIVVTDGNSRSIIIENKIYAGLRENQLKDYHEHNPKANLLFLTLRGEHPADWEKNSAYKTESFKRVFQPVSYKTDIVPWLESCRKEAATVPGVREIITQYIRLIQQLTQQNTSKRMNQEFIKAVTNDSSTFLAYASLVNANREIRKAIIAKVNAQLGSLGKELELETLEVFKAEGKSGDNYFYTTKTMEAQNLRFGLRCADSEYRNFGFGFAYINPELKSQLHVARFKDEFPGEFISNDFWHAFNWWNHHRIWDDETMAAIISDDFAPDLEALIRKLAKVTNEASKSPLVQTN